MDFQSSFVIVAWIFSFIILVVVLVALFYKPGRKFKVVAQLTKNSAGANQRLEFTVTNVGKKEDEVVAAFIRLHSIHDSNLFDLRNKVKACHLPVILKIGEKYDFSVPWEVLSEIMEKKSFVPINFKIIIENSVGMEFESKIIKI